MHECGRLLAARSTKKDEKLRREVVEAELLIGLITASSIESAYVLFELGARWGTDKHLLPLLGGKADSTYLRGPLSGYIALKCDETAQVQQFVGDVAELLGLEVNRPEAYEKKVKAVIETSAKLSAHTQHAVSPNISPNTRGKDAAVLSDAEIKILQMLSKSDGGKVPEDSIMSMLGADLTTTRYYLSKLSNGRYVSVKQTMHTTTGDKHFYTIEAKGREYLVVNNILRPIATIEITPRDIRK